MYNRIPKKKIASIGILFLLLLTAICTRFINLGNLPNGTYTDEAYGAYLAYGEMTSGIDDRGYSFPVYFVAWGSGMNALYLYLGILSFKLFGVSLLAYRIPQALFSVLAIMALYVIAKEFSNQKYAFIITLALTLNPWHIMNSRFGLESNIAPNMFLIACMFLVLGLKKTNKYFYPAALFLGLTLYCYAITWLIVPLFLLIFMIVYWKRIPKNKTTLFSCILLFLLALPLLIFLAINFDLLPEIRTPFFSIPKLSGFRGGEISFNNLKQGIRNFIKVIVLQQISPSVQFALPSIGHYYYFTIPFMVFGLCMHFYKLIKHPTQIKNDLSYIFLIWLACASLISILNLHITLIHVNMVHIPIIFYGAYGICELCTLLRNKVIYYACIIFGIISCGFFLSYYTQTYDAEFYGNKPYDAVCRAKELFPNHSITIYGYPTYKFPNLLWRDKPDMKDYAENKVYTDDPFFVELLEYKDYRFITFNDWDSVTFDGVYVISRQNATDFIQRGFYIEDVNDLYAIAYASTPDLQKQ